MRSEQEMLDLLTRTAEADERIRAVIMNGSRTNPNAARDIFQDYDIVYVVTEVESFTSDSGWIDRFGALMILQMPEAMGDPPPQNNGTFGYLMQFADGNRIDLTLAPIARLSALGRDSLSRLLLDKDGLIEPFDPPSERDYLPTPPTARLFADCCNEFWWVCPYVAKGLWREQIIYAKQMAEGPIRDQLMKMITWYIGVQTGFTRNPGSYGKKFKAYLEPELWTLLEHTYAGSGYEESWQALFAQCDLFRHTARHVAGHFGFTYPQGDDDRVSAHLQHVHRLPKDATAIY